MSLTGDWDDIESFLENIEDEFDEVGAELCKELSHQLAAEVKDRILSQSYTWEPLALATIKAKEKAGLDPRILIATGKYASLIGAYQSDDMWYAGVPDVMLDSGLSVQALSGYLEYGTATMPARPHWSVSFMTLPKLVRTVFKKYGLTYKAYD